MNKDQIETKLKFNIERRKVIDFRLIEGGDIILYLERERALEIYKKKCFWIESAWRISENNKMLGGSLDDEKFIMPILKNLQGRIIESVTLKEYGDLMICFEGGIIIESFVRSIEDEQWEFRERDGVCIGLGRQMKYFYRKAKKGERCQSAEVNE